MEIECYYIAKDGMRFTDPVECTEYEKTLSTSPGTVGRAKLDLQSIGKDKYVFGILKVKSEKKGVQLHTYQIMCLDDYLEDYVNVNDLVEDKRWAYSTMNSVLKTLGKYEDSDDCEYEFIYSDNKEMKSCGCTRSYNQRFWEKKENK